jgi:flavin-dependent dehydrogenase
MLGPPSTRAILRDGDSVAVVGGGPAGSFFAIHLLRQARRLGRRLDVVVIEKRGTADTGTEGFHCRGCSFCAGGISPRLHQILAEYGLDVPEDIIQGRFDYVWIQGQWKNFRLRVPRDMRMYSVFRGALPSRRTGSPAGFDGFLLGEAVKEGARVLAGEVRSIDRQESGTLQLAVRTPEDRQGQTLLDPAFVAIATGVNAHCGQDFRQDTLVACLQRLNPAFAPGKTRRALIFELDVGEEYLGRHMRREVYFIEYGSKNLPLEHTALVPKGRFLTVAMLGKCIDEAVFPGDRLRIVREFLALPQIGRILPGIDPASLACACTPRMTVTTARSPFGDRFAVIGDAVGARLNKDGLYSAHVTASRLAWAVLHDGIDARTLAHSYGKVVRWLAADNRFGRVVFSLSRAAFNRPLVGRITYQAFATEFKVRDQGHRPLGQVLWKIASGTADYRDVLLQMCSPGVLGSILTGAAVTVRNVILEFLFGLKWGEYGRYPTVVLKEKREAVKELIAASLRIPVWVSPDYERMYVIKIRGSAEEIIDELGKFGEAGSPFLNLRFVEVRRVSGTANQIGSIIRYRVPMPGLRVDLRLAEKNGHETLVYRLDRTLTENGRLIFHIAPTKDGNRRLAVYAAFDYRRGGSALTRPLWLAARLLFPGFVHDVVWNHALCTIKEDVERAHDRAPARLPAPSTISPA